jgi:hypothetical protein
MQNSRILDIARNIAMQTLVHAFACMLENAVLNVFRVVARLFTRDITRDGDVYRLWFVGCRTIRISHTFRPMLWDALNASDFQTHCIGNDSDLGAIARRTTRQGWIRCVRNNNRSTATAMGYCQIADGPPV